MDKRKVNIVLGTVFTLFLVIISSCSSDSVDKGVFPLSAVISHSVDDKKVAFQGLTHSAVSWSWDFGDGQTSNEQNPVHIYKSGGYYTAILTATNSNSNTVVSKLNWQLRLICCKTY